jgi:transcriptional regulator with XRE-family HTH domain
VETEQVGQRLRELRDEAGKTQLDLAYESGVGLRTIARYEQGDPGMKVANLAALARTLGVKLRDFWDDSGSDVRQPYLTFPAQAA